MITYDIITWDNMNAMGKTFKEGLKRRTTAEKHFKQLMDSKKFAMITIVKKDMIVDTPTAAIGTSGTIKTYNRENNTIKEKE